MGYLILPVYETIEVWRMLMQEANALGLAGKKLDGFILNEMGEMVISHHDATHNELADAVDKTEITQKLVSAQRKEKPF